MALSASASGQHAEKKKVLDDPVVVKRVLTKISLVLGLKMMSAAVCLNARTECFLKIYGNDSAAVARTLGTITSAGALLEFLLGPMLGRFSDSYGRKPALFFAPFVRPPQDSSSSSSSSLLVSVSLFALNY